MSRQNKIRKRAWSLITEYLKNYKWLSDEINYRRVEIISPYIEEDTNVGGGQSNIMNSPTEQTAIRLSDDIRIAQLERFKWAIDTTYNELDNTGQKFMDLYYFHKGKNLNFKGISIEINVHEQTVKNLNRKVIMRVGELVGMM